MSTEQVILANTLTPKFYVALTGTSSLISGLILIFEWWYFRKYGTSFIEQVSINHISPWIGNNDTDVDSTDTNNGNNNANYNNNNNNNGNYSTTTHNNRTQQVTECKIWRNPYNLFRGAEYQRFCLSTNKEPLSYHDMNLSAQEHQTYFECLGDVGEEEYELMQRAWRECDPKQRIKSAHNILELNKDSAQAYILLAEEEAKTITEAESMLRKGLKIAEINYRKSQVMQHLGPIAEGKHRRDVNVLIYIKRRIAMCARKLGRLKEATKMFRELNKEISIITNFLGIHENLIEALLESQLYVDCQTILSKYEDLLCARSATICFTVALLKTRSYIEALSSDLILKRNKDMLRDTARKAIIGAMEFNPHVPIYLLERKAIIFPPEHILKRGDSEAISYVFNHLKHWKNIDGALELFGTIYDKFSCDKSKIDGKNIYYPLTTCGEYVDRELLPEFHDIASFPGKELPFFILFTAGLCSFTAMLALITHQFPDTMGFIADYLYTWVSYPYQILKDCMNIINQAYLTTLKNFKLKD